MLRTLTLLLCLLAPFAANARVGVTSATTGDPLGKPPAQAERVLRIGIDVQANELITTGANDRAHLVFLDGTSLTVGPDARIVIDRFVFDPATMTGDLAVNAAKGVLRLVGGKISKKEPIVVTTPASTIGVRGGITLIDVEATKTTATFVFGKDMTVTGQGVTQTATRPGSQVVATLGAPPLPPVLVPPGGLVGQMSELEGRSGTATAPATTKVIVQGTELFGALPGQQFPVQPVTPTAAYAQPQQWVETLVATQAMNPTAYPAQNPNLQPNGPPTLQPPGMPQLPMTGTASYAGTFSGADTSGLAFGGTFSLGWNFASQTGMLNAHGAGQLNATATAPLTLIRNTTTFTGPLTANGLPGGVSGSGTVNGGFVPHNGSNVGGVAGGFSGSTSLNTTFGGTFSGTR